MSARALLQAAAMTALEGLPVTAVFDAPPVRAARPYAVVEEPVFIDWSTKDFAGRVVRFAVLVHDEGERPTRLRSLSDAVEAVIPMLPSHLGEGWRLIGVVLSRSRITRDGSKWTAMVEFGARMLRQDQ